MIDRHESLPDGVLLCKKHGRAGAFAGWTCPGCEREGVGKSSHKTGGDARVDPGNKPDAASSPSRPEDCPRYNHRPGRSCIACDPSKRSASGGREPRSKKPRPGQAAEDALCAALEAEGRVVTRRGVQGAWTREYGWGAELDPPRGFRSDLACPAASLLVEVDGGAHAAGRAKVKRDTERRGLAAAAGWRIVAVTPEQVRSGEAVALIVAAMEAT